MKTFVCIIMAFIMLLFVVHATAFSDDTPEWLSQRHYIDTDTARVYLEFQPLPYGPGANFDARLRWQERSIFSPQPPEQTLFLGPVIWHGGILRMGGMLDGYQFMRDCDGVLWLFQGGVQLTTEK